MPDYNVINPEGRDHGRHADNALSVPEETILIGAEESRDVGPGKKSQGELKPPFARQPEDVVEVGEIVRPESFCKNQIEPLL